MLTRSKLKVINSADSSKKTLVFIHDKEIAAHHVSFAVGPFEKVNLSEYRDQDEDDAMSAIAVEVMGYCLPGREHELRNTCVFMHKVNIVLSCIMETRYSDLGLTGGGFLCSRFWLLPIYLV